MKDRVKNFLCMCLIMQNGTMATNEQTKREEQNNRGNVTINEDKIEENICEAMKKIKDDIYLKAIFETLKKELVNEKEKITKYETLCTLLNTMYENADKKNKELLSEKNDLELKDIISQKIIKGLIAKNNDLENDLNDLKKIVTQSNEEKTLFLLLEERLRTAEEELEATKQNLIESDKIYSKSFNLHQ